MITASAIHLTSKQITPLFLLGQSELVDRSIGPFKQFFADDSGMVVGYLKPFTFIFAPYLATADLLDLAFPNDIGADIPFIR